MGDEDDLKSKIDTLHGKLNEFYEVDQSWRRMGKWSDDVRGSTLYPGASDDEIRQAEERVGHTFPPSYRAFLRLHSGWEHFWGDATLIGTARRDTERAQEKVTEYVKFQKETLETVLGEGFSPAAVTEWESDDPSNLYLAHHLVIGVDFSGAVWVYDMRPSDAGDEKKLTFWDLSYGAQDPTFDTFPDFIEWAIHEVEFRLEHIKRKKARDATQT